MFMRILQIVENLDKGAVENCLVNIFEESRKNRPDWEWTFYCILGTPGKLDKRVRMAGGKIIYSPVKISHKWQFLKALRDVLKRGHYDVLHAHHDYLSGVYLLASVGISITRKIVHIHNTDEALPIGNKILSRILLNPLGALINLLSDSVVGCSEDALTQFVKKQWIKPKDAKVLYYGVPLQKFSATIKDDFKSKLGLAKNDKIILYAGRFTPLKNPSFVIDILHELKKKRSDVYVVLVGEGDEEKIIDEKISEYQLSDFVFKLGWRDDLADIMRQVDVFIFPRLSHPIEGLGLVVVEAQCAGLPMLTTEGISDDAIVIQPLVQKLELGDLRSWARKINNIFDNPRAVSVQKAFEIMNRSKFSLGSATHNLIKLYEK